MSDFEACSQRPLDTDFVEALREAFISLAKEDFEVRLSRTGNRDTQDTIAYLFNLMAEEVGELFTMRSQHRERMEVLIASATEALVKIGTGELKARVGRSFDGSPEDVLAYLVNNAAEEVQSLFEELQQKNALLEEQANRQAISERTAFSTLSAGVGHELNNPLAYVSGNLEFVEMELQELRKDGDLERIPDLLEAIGDTREGVARAARIASDLKRLAPSVQMSFRAREVKEVVESALALIRNTVNHRAELRCDYGDVPPIMADEGRIGQVLVNLIQNALHALPLYRPRNENVIDIITFRHSTRLVAIEVRDNGEGIEPQNLRRIFDSFFTTRPVGQGTGLGLALSKRMIADHDGRMEVESTVGKGSTFRLLMPIARERP